MSRFRPLAFKATAPVAVFALLAAAPASSLGGVAYDDPGWDYVYDGDAAAFGTAGLGALDGTWRHDQSDRWDGSAPGEIGTPPAGASPGGVAALSEGGTTYLRIQDTGNPEQAQPDGSGGSTTPWSGESNRRIYFGHDIEQEHPGATSVLSSGITISFRARIASSGALDDVYPDFLDPEGEIPDLQQITPWPAGGKGYNVKDDGKGVVTVQQNGTDAVGFALALALDTPPGIGGGLIMNNSGQAPLPGTDRATQRRFANVVPIGDAALLDWHEFWITIEAGPKTDRFGRPMFRVNVYSDGALVPRQFDVMNSFGAEFAGQFLALGLPSTTSFGAVDIDFVAYRLGVVPPKALTPVPALEARGAVAAAVLFLLLGSGALLRARGRARSAPV